MHWPPWWLILAWVTMVPLGIRLLVNPVTLWSRPRREWTEEHPGDGYSSGWYAQSRFQAIFGLGLVAVATAGWLFHDHDAAHHDPPPRPKTDAAGAVAVMPDSYESTAKGLRLVWHTYGDGTDCPYDHVRVAETTTRVTVTIYEAVGTSGSCNEQGTRSGWWGDRPYTARHTDVSLRDPLGGRAVVNGEGTAIQTLAQSQGEAENTVGGRR